MNGLPAQHHLVGARREESLRGIGAWTDALSRSEAKVANATAPAAGTYASRPHDSHSSTQSPRASANRDREEGLLPMERFRRESRREEPFGGKRK